MKERPKVEVSVIPDLVQVDREIKRLRGRMDRLEKSRLAALQQGGGHWVDQVASVGAEMIKVIDQMSEALQRLNSVKERLVRR